MILSVKQKKFDITFICKKWHQHFADPILRELGKKYSIQYLFLERKRDFSYRKIRGNVIWVEWALKFAWLVSKKKWRNKKVFVRLHRYEIDTVFMRKINWEHIDQVIFVNDFFKDQFNQHYNHGTVETGLIPNAIAVDDFPMAPVNGGHRLLSYSLSFLPVKGYLELLEFFCQLKERNKAFHLTIMAQEPVGQIQIDYLNSIKEHILALNLHDSVDIVVRNRVSNLIEDKKQIPSFIAKHDMIVSFSQLESFHYAFAEGLLSGLQGFYNAWKNPLVRDFWGKWGYGSEEAMLEGIIQYIRLSLEEKQKIADKNRNYVIQQFGAEHIAKLYEEVFFR
jgi:glycosyltransferase involved in cell wall biosynthesis